MNTHIPPTIEQKIKIYEKALERIELEDNNFLCSALSAAQIELKYCDELRNIHFNSTSPLSDKFNNIETNFPEIVKHKPKDKHYTYTMPWWFNDNGNIKRINILKEEIKLLKEKIKP